MRVRIDGREVHATSKCDPSFESEVSQHTNEAGANFIDHARKKLIGLAIEGVVSDLEQPGSVQAMHEFLDGLLTNPLPVTVDTPLQQYPAMLLKVYRPKRRGQKALNFTAEFVEWRTTNLRKQTVVVKQRKQVRKGRQENKRPPPPRKSFFKSGANAAGITTPSQSYEVPGGLVDPSKGVITPR